MLNDVKNYIENLLKGSKEIALEDVLLYGDKKLSAIISKKGYWASFEVLPNLEYDFTIISTKSEAIISSKSKKFEGLEQLYAEIKEDFNAFSGE